MGSKCLRFALAVLCILVISGLSGAFAFHPMVAKPFDGIVSDQEEILNEQIQNNSLVEPSGTRDMGVQGVGDRMVSVLCNAFCGGKGWGWPLACPSTPESVPANTLGPAGVGLLKGYEVTDDIDHLIGAFEAGDYAKCYTYPSGQYRMAVFTPYFLWYITHLIPSATSYANHAQVNFFDALDAEIYGPPPAPGCTICSPYNTSEFMQNMWSVRSEEYCNIRCYDRFVLPLSAMIMGTPSQYDIMLDGPYGQHAAINQIDKTKWWDVDALAEGIASIAMLNDDFDVTGGDFAELDDIMEMTDKLLIYQHPMGGFVWTTQYMEPLQKTAWALGTGEWYSGQGNWLNTAITKEFTVSTSTTITYKAKFNIRNSGSGSSDYGYVEYSADGGLNWNMLTDSGYPSGYRGCLATYSTRTVTLPALGTYLIRFRYLTDSAFQGMSCSGLTTPGFYIDDINIDGVNDPCDAQNGWVISNEDWGLTLTEDAQSLQTTAYCLLALKTADLWKYEDAITATTDWMWTQQLVEGGFQTYPGGGVGSENSQVDGEALWALTYQPDCFNDGDVNNSNDLTPEDAQMAFQYYLGTFPSTPIYHDFCSADCDGSGDVTPADALCIWKHFLAMGCDCTDAIVAKKKVAAGRIGEAIHGVLDSAIQYNPRTQQLVLTIKAEDFSNKIDSLGLKLSYSTEDLAFVGSEFGKSVESFDFKAAEEHDGIIIVGAFDAEKSFTINNDTTIISLTFDVLTPIKDLDQLDVGLFDLVDDIGGFGINLHSGMSAVSVNL